MICYRCKSELTASDVCIKCGAKVGTYKKIVKASNQYYNWGLQKAMARDLSGAADDLKKSLKLFKYQTDARNLLGLIYYETGEIVEAMSEWVISTHLQPDNNVADEYLRYIQNKQNRLARIDQSVRKFNQALALVREGSDDLAQVQLLNVIKASPKYVKAHQLLTLLYIKGGEYQKAYKQLKHTLSIDKGNTLSLLYMKEIKTKARVKKDEKLDKKVRADEEEPIPLKVDNGVIIPTYHEGTGILQAVLKVAAGIVLGLIMAWFLIFPSMEQGLRRSYEEAFITYGNQLSAKDAQIEDLQTQIESLNQEKTDVTDQLNQVTGADGVIAEYDKLLQCMRTYQEGDLTGAISQFQAIDSAKATSQTFQACYEFMRVQVEENGATQLYNLGMEAYNQNDFETARGYLEQCVALRPDGEALFWLGICYESTGQQESAIQCYNRILTEFADSPYVMGARQQLEQLGAAG